MAHECGICSRGEEAASVVNELLWKKEKGLLKIKYEEIAAQVGGTSTSSVNRHAHGACRYNFLAYRAARLKSKSKKPVNGRTFVQWPGEALPDGITAADIVLVVRYRQLEFTLGQQGYVEDAVIDAVPSLPTS